MPDLLREQFPHFRPIVEAFGYRNLEFEGWEADDVIATLATRADETGIQTCVVSTDRDAFQLCSENVSLMMTPRGVADVHVYTPERVELRYGVRPDQVPDFIGLKGDTSDNIPGIPGIGDKTAGQLIAQYGSLEEVIAHADELSPARSRAVREHADQARDSKLLATMRRDLPLDVDPAELVSSPPDRSALKEIFRRFEFRGLLSRVDTLDEAIPAAAPTAETESVAWRETALEELVLNQHKAPFGLARADDRAAVSTGDEVLVVQGALAEIRRAVGGAEIRTHDAKSQRLGPVRRRHPHRRLPRRPGPLRLRARRPGPRARRRARPRACRRGGDRRARPERRIRATTGPAAARSAPRMGLGAALRRGRAAAHRRARGHGAGGDQDRRVPDGRDHRPPRGARRGARGPGARARRASLSSSARRSSSHGSSSRSSSSPRAGRGRPATRPIRASCVRSATTTRSSPSSRSGVS